MEQRCDGMQLMQHPKGKSPARGVWYAPPGRATRAALRSSLLGGAPALDHTSQIHQALLRRSGTARSGWHYLEVYRTTKRELRASNLRLGRPASRKRRRVALRPTASPIPSLPSAAVPMSPARKRFSSSRSESDRVETCSVAA